MGKIFASTSSSLESASQTESRFEYLTGLRGIAAVIVLLSHIIQIFWLRYENLPSYVLQVSSFLSTYAVVIFFVLSGFLIAHSIEENLRRNLGIFNIKSFIAARVARIYPPFLYSVMVSIVVFTILSFFNMPGVASPLKFPGDIYAARDFIKLPMSELALSLMMLQGMLDINGPLWSLYIEVKLYLIFACFYLLLLGRNRILAISGFLLITYLSLRFNPDFLRYAVIWLAGCIAYYLFGTQGRRLKLNAMACGSLILLIICYDIAARLFILPLIFQGTRFIFIDLAISFLISAIILFFRFKIPLADKAGMFSYSLYVTHFPVLILVQSAVVKLGDKSLSMTIVASVFAFFFALVVGLVGGLIEAHKVRVQMAIAVIWSRVLQPLKLN